MVRAAAVSIAAALAVIGPAPHDLKVRVLVTNRDDAQLVNAWGLAASATGPWWVANEARGSSTLYSADGRKQAVTVHVPGGPTGVAWNSGSGFVVGHGQKAVPARVIYACEDGMIRAWAPGGWSRRTVVAVDAASTGTVFRGLTLAGGHLYATDFHNGRVLVFDERWHPIESAGAFVDRAIPEWYAPFNIAAFDGHLFVSYAWRAPVNGNDAPSGGYVDEFDLDGHLVSRVAGAGSLDEPWGLALAPPGFGRFGGNLLVANFGSGHISAFARRGNGWVSAGQLHVEVPGVWGIAFGTGGMSGAKTTLFFASGPHGWNGDSEADVGGALGSIS